MRLNRLDLIRYGKFTDQQVSLPRASHDFHLVLGANEAGKSTLRGAILDLLFGFPVRTPIDFLHPKSELRVGAVLEQGGETLEFVRLKANKNTLRSPDQTPLPDTALDNFLGAAGRAFFDKMFGLDHPRLVEGGNSILSAQDDVGQVLFQSAAGLASLGRVRDALEQEADGLWAPTRSSKRVYYRARDDLDEASAALKAATVRTREWAEAHDHVQNLTAQAEAQRALLIEQQARRGQLERVRRVNPVMRDLSEAESLLAALGPVVDLGPDAAQTLAQAERAQAMAQHGLGVRRGEVARLDKEISDIAIDDTLLAAADRVEALEALRLQYGAHEQLMTRCQGQLDQLWKEVLQALDELGLNTVQCERQGQGSAADVQALRARLPGLPSRKQVERLLREHDGIHQAVDAALAAQAGRQAEAQAIEAKLRAQAVPQVASDLRAALETAKGLGDPDVALQKAMALRDKAKFSLEEALAGLGTWSRPPEQLQSLDWPSTSAMASWLAERRALSADAKAAAQRCEELDAAAQHAALRARQYGEQHHPTTQEALAKARRDRDETWQAIKRGERATADTASEFESLVHQADVLADSRHDTAQEAAQMQHLLHQREQSELDLNHARARRAACQAALAEFDVRWQSICEDLRLSGLPLEQAPDWLVGKDRALEANRALGQANHDMALLQATHQNTHDRLAHALGEGFQAPAGGVAATLDSLRAKAEAALRDADAAKVRHDTWLAQAAEARPALEAAQQVLTAAQARKADWHAAWSLALAQLGLDDTMGLGAAEGALELLSVVADKLEQMRRLRSERLDVMQGELDGFVAQAARLAQAVAPASPPAEELSYAEALDLCQVLAARLAIARRAQERVAALKQARATEREEIRRAEQLLREARVKVQPLMDRAGVDTLEALADAVKQSDPYRALRERVDQAQARLLQEGDGLTRGQLQAELAVVDVTALLAQWTAVQADIEQSTKKQSELAVALAEAQRRLDAMTGVDSAARAEARRQDALARMSDAAERYIKVFTAARLLRWSIDRYREEQQGPMLARASTIFAQLTLNSFERLRVDFDRHPMVLEGQRADGQRVGIAGLSDGTRDQLYLALRLAALELHLEHAPALPFIADDLFINYDDARSEAGLRALAGLSRRTQVIFLSHHDALLEPARRVFGDDLNVVTL